MDKWLKKIQNDKRRRSRHVGNIHAIYKKDVRVSAGYAGVSVDVSYFMRAPTVRPADLWVDLNGRPVITTPDGSKTYRRLNDALNAFDKLLTA